MAPTRAITLKKYPFIRLLLPLICGIILEWYFQFSLKAILISSLSTVVALAIIGFFSVSQKFLLRWLNGILIMLLFGTIGSLVTYAKDIRHQSDWIGNYYKPGDLLLITLEEPLVEKDNSYKALTSVTAIKHDTWINTQGKILVYFKKDNLPAIGYGSQLLLHKPLQPIVNSGNPGSFDYKRYCLFQNITSRVFINQNEYIVLPNKNINRFQQKLFVVRDLTLKTLKKYIPGVKEQGVAEALLIGYRDDLDKDLVQAYSNTGVVHIIAISGLHLGMIYGLLLALFSLFKQYRWTKWVQPFIILFVLWIFTLLAGAVPSILRSAVMFSLIVTGKSINRKTNIYNTLAASAFCMLVYNPFILWNVGFLLSYAAVISIITFMKPLYRLLYFKNRALDKIWSLTAVTISAQVLTIPIVIFYFHQFPNLFLVTNFFVVPASGFLLYGEILLICISFIQGFAKYTGIILSKGIWMMNSFIENINNIPFAVWNNLQITALQTWLFYGLIIGGCIWLARKYSIAFLVSLACLTTLIALISVDIIKRNNQQKLIIYNIPKYSAIDIVQGKHYHFIGDSILLKDGFLKNFHLKPARILYRCSSPINQNNLSKSGIINVDTTSLMIIDDSFHCNQLKNKIPVDIIVLSKNLKIHVNELQNEFIFKQLIFDSSNSPWKIERWKKDCDSLHLRFHSVPDQGAFVMDL